MALKVSKEKKKNYWLRAIVCLIVGYVGLRLGSQGEIDGKLTLESMIYLRLMETLFLPVLL